MFKCNWTVSDARTVIAQKLCRWTLRCGACSKISPTVIMNCTRVISSCYIKSQLIAEIVGVERRSFDQAAWLFLHLLKNHLQHLLPYNELKYIFHCSCSLPPQTEQVIPARSFVAPSPKIWTSGLSITNPPRSRRQWSLCPNWQAFNGVLVLYWC